MYNPISTYRIQFHKGFTFKDFLPIIPYLHKLGVGAVYASPIFEAIPGSTHGYDCTNPLRINPEIGTLEELRQISHQLKAAGMGWIQDIVPNHMAYHANNKWLMDVLEKGKESEYATFFDIQWNNAGNEKPMVPFLGQSVEECIEEGSLKVVVNEGKPTFNYYDTPYPLSSASIKEFAINNEDINANKTILLQLANAQPYRLCAAEETDQRINFRRFFIVNNLICLNIQDENVFAHHHSFIKQLLDEGIFQGLRIDHIDGLQNPEEYLKRLRQLAGEEAYIVVEKILEPGEELPSTWPLQGSTGYDFLSQANNLFTHTKSQRIFSSFYQSLTGNYASIHQQLRDKKAYILANHMQGELDNLYHLLLNLDIVEQKALSVIPDDDVKSVLGEFLVQFPVYRFYGNSFPLPAVEEDGLKEIIGRLKKSDQSLKAIAILEDLFLHLPHQRNAELNARIAKFYTRCMQFTGPLMAKGVEDTLMYTYNRFIGHNEVGDSPEAFGFNREKLHQYMQQRQQQWPLSMNATSTHDTKRGEDVRARLNVISDLGEDWIAKVEEWRKMNTALKKEGSPDANDEYLIYQALVGHYHFSEAADFNERLDNYLEKALREAKTHSNWTAPDADYEAAAKEFAHSLLNKSTPFWKNFQAFGRQIEEHCIINSLAQVMVKFALPGLPDTYQGCELWDNSFVDPDNRRPVDYAKRIALLHKIENDVACSAKNLWQQKEEGHLKFWLTHKLLILRRGEASLFAEGDYLPLQTSGKYSQHLFAFARKQADRMYIFVLPLHTAILCNEQQTDFFGLDWGDTKVVLTKEAGSFHDAFTDAIVGKGEGLLARNLFKEAPFAIIKGKEAAKERGAGILTHISSLPSPFGVGDLGPGAKSYADFLHRSGQKYWQLLPLNPADAGQGYSPYSALSSKAGWWLYISPELLVRDGLLKADDLNDYHLPNEAMVYYDAAERIKAPLIASAYENFLTADNTDMHKAFALFCEKEKGWLDDFALYVFFKQTQGGKPWYQWPDELKKRNAEALQKISAENNQSLQKTKWEQFIFITQWNELKGYCTNRSISLIGDMPFYVSYDSADVWAAQHLFAVDAEGNLTGIAGVPPDRFSDDGQFWGMPTFNWERMKEDGYQWWIQRLRKNIELFTITRLDHFRAFAAYWHIPATETTAKNGTWTKGPGFPFFKLMQREFGDLPFIAEDLGKIDDDVINLRDDFKLPGMKILHFAFGDGMPQSGYIPHNYGKNFLVYTGTHDNNTTIGWWKTEADENVRHQVRTYVGQDVNEHNVHITLTRMAYASVANIAILPMQDILGLDERGRMNTPSMPHANWTWRLMPHQLTNDVENMLREWVWVYDR